MELSFRERGRRREAAETFRTQGFTRLVCIGGNGTLEGEKAMLEEFAVRPPVAGLPRFQALVRERFVFRP